MIEKHVFIFSPGRWIGEGKITFSASMDHLRFYTSWQIGDVTDENKIIPCYQRVEMQGADSAMENAFFVELLDADKFKIQLENELLGSVEGSGLIDSSTIAWEFRHHSNIEGFEVYELQENGDYMFHAEYASPDQFRTIIDGRIWKKSSDGTSTQ